MSHIATIKAECKDRQAIDAACRRLALRPATEGTAVLFGTKKTGTIVRLPDWAYPIVIDRSTGEISYDNYNGAWGSPKRLDAFRQAYAIEKGRIEAQRKGYSVKETTRQDGTIELEILAR